MYSSLTRDSSEFFIQGAALDGARIGPWSLARSGGPRAVRAAVRLLNVKKLFERFAHHGSIGFHSRPQFEADDRLIDEHT